MIDFVNTPGTIVLSQDGKHHIVGATEKQNEAFRARLKTFSIDEEALRARKDAVELKGITQVEYGSENYYNLRKIKGMPNSVFGTAFGYKTQKEIANCMRDYYTGKISREEVKENFGEFCSSMRIYCAQERFTNGTTKEDNEQIVSEVYEIFAKENARAARGANYQEGISVNKENGFDEGARDWIYYNSEFCDRCEEIKGLLREAVGAIEEKWELGKIDCDKVEANSKLTLDGGFDFNSGWSWQYYNRTGKGKEEEELSVPSEKFRLFYKENYKENRGLLKLWTNAGERTIYMPFVALGGLNLNRLFRHV